MIVVTGVIIIIYLIAVFCCAQHSIARRCYAAVQRLSNCLRLILLSFRGNLIISFGIIIIDLVVVSGRRRSWVNIRWILSIGFMVGISRRVLAAEIVAVISWSSRDRFYLLLLLLKWIFSCLILFLLSHQLFLWVLIVWWYLSPFGLWRSLSISKESCHFFCFRIKSPFLIEIFRRYLTFQLIVLLLSLLPLTHVYYFCLFIIAWSLW